MSEKGPFEPPQSDPVGPASRLENLANRLSDMDWGWWPFMYLRPKPHELMTTAHVAKMALHFGPVVGVVLTIVFVLRGRAQMGTGLIPTFLYLTVGSVVFFFIGYRITFANWWNRRARRLSGSR